MGMVVAMRWRRVVVGTVIIFSTVEATRSRQGVVMRVVVRVRGKVW